MRLTSTTRELEASARLWSVCEYVVASAFAHASSTCRTSALSSPARRLTSLRRARSSAVITRRVSIFSPVSSEALREAETSDTLSTSVISENDLVVSAGLARRAASITSDVLPAPR